MDIFTHAMVGAATGLPFGYPVAGAVAAVVPDVALWGRKRVQVPPTLYQWGHALITPLAALLIIIACGHPILANVVYYAWMSHIILDIPTHGQVWAPRLFLPFDKNPTFTCFQEWEWFNHTWWAGFRVSLLWSILCVLMWFFVTGSRL